MPNTKPTYTIQGMRFRLKPTTPNNLKRMEERFNELDPDEPEVNEYEQYKELLKYLVDPVGEHSVNAIDVNELDLVQVEGIFQDFIPRLTTISTLLGG
jgi:hypothetical protein